MMKGKARVLFVLVIGAMIFITVQTADAWVLRCPYCGAEVDKNTPGWPVAVHCPAREIPSWQVKQSWWMYDHEWEVIRQSPEETKLQEFLNLCSQGTPQQIRTAIKAGAKVNAQDSFCRTPLHYAVSNKNLDSLSTLIEAGGDVNAYDSFHMTPLSLALNKVYLALDDGANLGVITALLKAGANVNIQSNRMGRTPLHLAVINRFLDGPDVIAALLKAGANVNATDYYGDTPLYFCHNPSSEIANLLRIAGGIRKSGWENK
jgi:hypothetical protein